MGQYKISSHLKGGKLAAANVVKAANVLKNNLPKGKGKGNKNGASSPAGQSGDSGAGNPDAVPKITILYLLGKLKDGFMALVPILFKRDSVFAHYFVLFLVIVLLIGGISFAVRNKKAKRKGTKKKTLYDRIFGYRANLFFQQLDPTLPSTPRPTLAGRCDNTTFIENGTVCVNNKMPPPIQWVIDSDKIPELKDLPTSIKNKLSKDGVKFTVTIPWKSDGMIYSPDCEKTTFADGTPAYLLVDGGGFCKKIELEKPAIYAKYRYDPNYSKYTEFGDFVENPDPSSSLLEKVSAGEVCSIETAKKLGIYDKDTFYKRGYDTLRTYNNRIDATKTYSHMLCSTNTVNEDASSLCPLIENAGIGFTSKPGGKCVTAECPPGFEEDTKDPVICKKPIVDRIVQLNKRNDERYDDWYTIPNYHLGNRFSSSNNVHFAPCEAGNVPYFISDPVDGNSTEEDRIQECVDKSIYMGGKYADNSDFCPVSMIMKAGSNKADLENYYKRVTNTEDIPPIVKRNIEKQVASITADTFANLSLLTPQTENACNKINQDPDKLIEAYNICELLSKNEPGFINKFNGEPEPLVKLRTNAVKYSCQQLFGVPPADRGNPLIKNDNAIRIEKPTLNFPDAEQIQFDQYIKEYETEVQNKNTPLPTISAAAEQKRFVGIFKNNVPMILSLIVTLTLLSLIWVYRCPILSTVKGWWNITADIIGISNKFTIVPCPPIDEGSGSSGDSTSAPEGSAVSANSTAQKSAAKNPEKPSKVKEPSLLGKIGKIGNKIKDTVQGAQEARKVANELKADNRI